MIYAFIFLIISIIFSLLYFMEQCDKRKQEQLRHKQWLLEHGHGPVNFSKK